MTFGSRITIHRKATKIVTFLFKPESTIWMFYRSFGTLLLRILGFASFLQDFRLVIESTITPLGINVDLTLSHKVSATLDP